MLCGIIRCRYHRHVSVCIQRVGIFFVLDIFTRRYFCLDLCATILIHLVARVSFFRHLNVQSRLGSRPAATSVSRSSGTFSTTARIHVRRSFSLIRFFRILPRTTSRTLVFFRICIFLVAGIVVLVLVLVHVGHISHSTTRRRVPCFGLISSRAFRSSSGTIFIVRIFQHSRIFPVRRIFIRHAAGIFIASGGGIAVVEVWPFRLVASSHVAFVTAVLFQIAFRWCRRVIPRMRRFSFVAS